jgi:dTDP-glucose 4,6-dehydratase
VSTDEVYGALGKTGKFTEQTPYAPNSPYSATKAGSDHLARAYYHTYGFPALTTNCSNNYGPRQHPEKLIPLAITRMLKNEQIPIYGDGKQVRDWLYVDDHCKGIYCALQNGRCGETYNIGGNNEWENIALLDLLCDEVDKALGRELGASRKLQTFVQDRPGHDRRYAIDAEKIETELGWRSEVSFSDGISKTVQWYLANYCK